MKVMKRMKNGGVEVQRLGTSTWGQQRQMHIPTPSLPPLPCLPAGLLQGGPAEANAQERQPGWLPEEPPSAGDRGSRRRPVHDGCAVVRGGENKGGQGAGQRVCLVCQHGEPVCTVLPRSASCHLRGLLLPPSPGRRPPPPGLRAGQAGSAGGLAQGQGQGQEQGAAGELAGARGRDALLATCGGSALPR